MNLNLKRSFLSVCLIVLATTGAAMADNATLRKFENPYTSIALMNAGKQGHIWQSGLHITIQKDWKTYWRVPGDGGVPPQFDWTGSQNVASATVMMPLPHRFVDQNGEGIGYKTEVVLPVAVTPKNPDLPVHVSVKVFYAVCNDICVPVLAELKHTLEADTVSVADGFLLKVAQSSVPEENTDSPVQLVSMKVAEASKGSAIDVHLKGLGNPQETDIFVEMEGISYFRKPELISTNGTDTVWRLSVDQPGQQASLVGKKLRLTISDGKTGLVREGVLQ